MTALRLALGAAALFYKGTINGHFHDFLSFFGLGLIFHGQTKRDDTIGVQKMFLKKFLLYPGTLTYI